MEAVIGGDLERAAILLRSGELVGIPTETVYGLAGNGLDESALLKIFKTKNRPFFDPLILHVSGLDKTRPLVKNIPAELLALIERFWPGPLTVLLEKSPIVPDLATAGETRVALRSPSHPVARQLLSRLDFPLAAPSANPFGYVSPTSARHVAAQLGSRIPYILDGGECEIGLESTIIGSGESGELIVYRRGAISEDDIRSILPKTSVKLAVRSEHEPKAPGNLASHYAPKTPFQLFKTLRDFPPLGEVDERRKGWILFEKKSLTELSETGISFGRKIVKPKEVRFLSADGSLESAARNLYAILREMDDMGLAAIQAEKAPDQGLGLAINDRLLRAAGRG